MSARQRKRLQETNDAATLGSWKPEGEKHGSDDESQHHLIPARGKFHLLMQDDDSTSGSESDAIPESVQPALPFPASVTHVDERNKVKSTVNRSVSSVPSDVLLQELPPLDNLASIAIFKPTVKFLNADTEVLRMLADGAARSYGGMPRETRGARGHRNVLVSPEHGWSPMPTKAAGGMSMARRAEWRKIVEFALDPSEELVHIQQQYRACVELMDPRSIVAFLRTYPYCMEGMLDLAHYYRTTRQHEAATKMLRQCLFALETAFHPLFRPWEVCCAIRYNTTNEILYRVLWQAMMAAGRAAAPRTALEIAKLMLCCSNAAAALPSETEVERDPMRALLVVDHFAARSREWDFILRLTGGPGRGLCLAQSPVSCVWLPSLAFARSLALFHTEVSGSSLPLQESRSSRHAGTAAGVDMCSDLSYTTYCCLRMLIRSFLVFPHMLIPLASQLGLTTKSVGTSDAHQASTTDERVVVPRILESIADTSCHWNVVLLHPLFRDAADGGDDCNGVRHLCSAYAQRNVALFRVAGVLRWLYTGALLAAHMFERTRGGRVSVTLDEKFTSILKSVFVSGDLITAETYSSFLIFDNLYAAGERTPASPILNARLEVSHYSRVVISDLLDELPTVSEEELRAMQEEVPAVQEQPSRSRQRTLDLQGSSLVALFFSSLAPWNGLPNT